MKRENDVRPALARELLQAALDGSDHPAEAVTALMSAAASILQRNFGEEGALALMTQALDATAARRRAAAAN